MIPEINSAPTYYNGYKLREYSGNPLIEALKPPPETDEEAVNRLLLLPEFQPEDRDLSKAEKVECVNRLRHFMFPMKRQVSIFRSVYDLIFAGLVSRNPLAFNRLQDQYGSKRVLAPVRSPRQTSYYRPAQLSLIVGPSGVGKTVLAHGIMHAMGENIIKHYEYQSKPFTETQITYLHTNVPGNCNARNLCGRFIAEVDALLQSNFYSENYDGKYITKDEYLEQFQRIISELHVGGLFVDEIQNLSIGRSGGKEDLIAFLVNIRDKIGIPIILIGTNKVAQLLTGEMALVRRLLDGGIHHIEPFASPNDKSWLSFCEATWGFQWLKEPSQFTTKIGWKLFEFSAGIPALMLDLFQKSQKRAINSNKEYINEQSLIDTYNDEMKEAHELIEGVKRGDKKILQGYEDYYFEIKSTCKKEQEQQAEIEEIIQAFKRGSERARGKESELNKLNNKELLSALSKNLKEKETK
ncbi:MAG: family ATPase [Firmicutes bacterium]|jgi:hypothetical protein|nr:family ATPase [Bacillota bacterium]